MKVTEVRIKLADDNPSNDRIRAYCSVTLDGVFVIRDMKVIDGMNGLFVAMPSRKMTDRCNSCGVKNSLQSWYCSRCGANLDGERGYKGDSTKIHADICHPVNVSTRELFTQAIIDAYKRELELAKQPGYICRFNYIPEE
jgi:stage V sporulation protein G